MQLYDYSQIYAYFGSIMANNPKIPFGWHTIDHCFKDAHPNSVGNGDSCACICHECLQPLQAVQGEIRLPHFRHKYQGNCAGSLESLLHKTAKQILKENEGVYIDTNTLFHYDDCQVELAMFNKRPDAFLTNRNTKESWIVEFSFTHKLDEEKISRYRENNQKVLDIDISEGVNISDYTELTNYIIRSAPRVQLLPLPTSKVNYTEEGFSLFKIIGLVGLIVIGIFFLLVGRTRK